MTPIKPQVEKVDIRTYMIPNTVVHVRWIIPTWNKIQTQKSKLKMDGYMLNDNVGQIVMIISIVAAVGIFVGSRLWMVFRK